MASDEIKAEIETTKQYVCYIIESEVSNRTYVGITNNLKRRLRQHQGELVGGAKYTRIGKPWLLVAYVSGFQTHKQVLQFEWMLKRMPPKSIRGIRGRAVKLAGLVRRLQWTKRAPLSKTVPLVIHSANSEFRNVLHKYGSSLPAHISVENLDDIESSINESNSINLYK